VSAPAPADVLRHRAPALLLGAVERFDGAALACASSGAGPWRWPAMLEGAAQAAGLLAGLQPGGPSNRAVIAEYRDVRIRKAGHAGRLRFHVRLDRQLMRFWRCRFEACDERGEVLVDGTVTIAPPPGE
jgi:hypothetical protein